MKLSWQLVVVIVAGIVGMVATVIFLSAAGWSEGGIAGMVTLFSTVVTAIIVQVRGQQNAAQQLTEIQQKADRIVSQTNGASDQEREDIAQRAAIATAARVARQQQHDQYRGGMG